jgi:hypothetical protein
MPKQINFEEVTLRLRTSDRGGGIEIDLTRFGFKDEKMTAYQNYLGGGMLGRVVSDDTIRAFNKPITEKQNDKLNRIAERLRRYFHDLTNHADDEWESETYEQNQTKSASAY